MQDEIKKLVSYIPVGKANPINAPELAEKMGLPSGPNQEELRAIIRQAIAEGELIGSNSSGYWIVDSIEELNVVMDALERRAQGVCDRRNKLLTSWNDSHPDNQTDRTFLNVKS